jgi:hypothetical protein
MSFVLTHPVDFGRHNEEVERVWQAYRAGAPYRTPVVLSGSISNLLCNPAVNTTGYSFRDFFENPQAQVEAQLAFQKWWRSNLLCDQQMGPPADGWRLSVDLQNTYDAGWLGCPLHYAEGAVPDALPILRERAELLYGLEPPDPLRGGVLGRAMEFFDYMQERCPHLEFEGLPVLPPQTIPGEGTDGPFTLAYKLRGATELCMDVMEHPEYVHGLMGFVTDNLIRRMKAIRTWRWGRRPDAPDAGQFKRPGWGFADDGIVVLSVAQYRQFVLPYHKRLAAEFSDGSPISLHLCGDASRFFPLMRDELNVRSFDTGFPVPWERLREEVGPDVEIRGGPSIALLKAGPLAKIEAEVKRICSSGIMRGGRFILREGNNLAPGTPVEHVEAMYEAGRRHARYTPTASCPP